MQTTFGFVDNDSGLPVSVVTFGTLADELKKYSSGSTIWITGKLQKDNFTNSQSEEKRSGASRLSAKALPD